MNQKKWIKTATRSLSLYKADIYFRGLRAALKKFFDLDFDDILVSADGEECELYFGKEAHDSFAQLIKDHFVNSINNGRDPFELLDRIRKNMVEYTEEIGNRKILSKKDLINYYETFVKMVEDYNIILWFPVICEEKLLQHAKDRLIKTTGDEKLFDTLVEPFEPSALQKEQIELLKIAQLLKNHQKKYAWMSMRFFDQEPLDLNHFLERIKEIQNPGEELERIQEQLNEKRIKFYETLNSFNFSRQDRELLIAVNKLNLLRQTRDEDRRKAYYNIRPFFDRVLDILDCDYKTLLSNLDSELRKALEENKINYNDIKGYIYLIKDGNFELITEDIEKKLQQEGIKTTNLETKTEIKGTPANKGIVKGKVKLINLNSWKQDVAAVEKGDILIAISTKPDYILAMDKASAFVTDEGGLLCHAAIVSREMNKPCIVGTDSATKIFKDGDLVEVDANQGIIKKIK